MTIIKQTIVDQIEITQAGHLQVRMKKQLIEDGEILSAGNHRTSIEVGGDVNGTFDSVNVNLVQMGWPAVEDSDWQRVRDIAAVTWTAAVVQDWATFKAAVISQSATVAVVPSIPASADAVLSSPPAKT